MNSIIPRMKRTKGTDIAAVLLVLVALAAAIALGGCSTPQATAPEDPAATEQPAETPSGPSGTAYGETPSGIEDVTELKIEDAEVGTGAEAVAGKAVTVNYTGWLTDGTKFDSSVDSGQPFTFNLGAGEVIPGWDEGVAGMKVGGKRRLIIPAAMAYGEAGAGGVIPPNATLVFDVELLDVK